MKHFQSALRTGIILIFLLASCSLDTPSPDDPGKTPQNNPPVVNAGEDQLLELGEEVLLRGSVADLDNDPLTYLWTLVEGPLESTLESRDIQGVTTQEASCLPDKEGVYTFDFSASDGKSTVVDRVIITISPTANQTPLATATVSDLFAVPGSQVSFGGYGQDPDQDTMVYRLTMLSQPAGSELEFQNDDRYYAGTDMVVQTLVLQHPGDYNFMFTATDSRGLAGNSELTVKVLVPNPTGNTAPLAHAGEDITISQGLGGFGSTWYNLDGNGSRDLDGDPLSFSWSCISAPPKVTNLGEFNDYLGDLTIVDPEYPSALPSGTYVFQLTVDDGQGFGTAGDETNQPSIATDTMTLTVVDRPGGIFSVIVEGSRLLEEISEPVTVSGQIYPDRDNYFLGSFSGIEMTLVSRPAGSAAVMNTPVLSFMDIIQVKGTITPDVPGDYRFRVEVTGPGGSISRDVVYKVVGSTEGGVDVVIN